MKIGNQRGEVGNWIGIAVRDRNGRHGKVVEDWCAWDRILTILFEDGERYNLVLNNVGKDPEDKLGIEWEFSPQEFPHKWVYISDTPVIHCSP
ncbi:hypothetical protein IQ272_16140 [Chroococcidiopsidales cyanobacterium LEGE 13417]|nr:hypothetical protein [Chroococcidiopsidales cyanobacterium LEGE 13417]